jgi:hypothetical protein
MAIHSPLSTAAISKLLRKYDEVLKKEGEKKADKVFEHVPIPSPQKKNKISNKELLKTVQSGDIILWSGSSGISLKIRLSSDCPFSHASIVFKGALDKKEEGTKVVDVPRIFQSTWSKFKEDVDGKHSKVSRQVMLNDLSVVLRSNETEGEPATLRILKCNTSQRKSCTEKLAAFIKDTDGDMYPGAEKGVPSFASYLKGLKGIRIDNPRKFVCSELVAEALQRMDVLSSKKAVNSYAPLNFTDKFYDKLKQQLKDGYGFGPETFVVR